jgi:hypothetical protein
LETRMVRAPRLRRARAVFSPASPAPMTMTGWSRRELKIFSGQFHGDGSDGDAAALDVGFGADLFGDVEGFLENLVQTAAGVLVPEGGVVGFFQLAEDFRFAQDHGIQAAGDLEEVFQAAGIGVAVESRRPTARAIGGSPAKNWRRRAAASRSGESITA